MTYLLLKIFSLLLGAAVLGFLLGRWWWRRQFEDVTVEYTRLSSNESTQAAELKAAREARAAAEAALAKLTGERDALTARLEADATWRDKLDGHFKALGSLDLAPALARLDALDQRIAGLKTPDVAALTARLDDINKSVAANRGPDVSAMLARFTDLERTVRGIKPPDNEPVLSRISALASTVAAFKSGSVDLGPLNARLDALDARIGAITMPSPAASVDFAPISGRLAAIEHALEQCKPTDTTPVLSGISALASSVAAIKPSDVDLRPLYERLDAIESRVAAIKIPAAPALDLEPIASRLSSIESNLVKIQPTDMVPVLTGISALASTVAAIKPPSVDFGSLHARLEALDERVKAIKIPAATTVDFGPIVSRLDALENRVGAIKPPAPTTIDLSPIVSRLDALENRVGAIKPPAPATIDLNPIASRLSAIESMISKIKPTDTTPVLTGISTLASTVAAIKPASVDLGPLSVRLAALEARVAEIKIPAPTTVDLTILLSRLEALETMLRQAQQQEAERDAAAQTQTLFLTHHRPGGGRNLLTTPVFGEPDDLLRIVGVGPVLLKLLHELGVYYFWQISEWTLADVRFVDSKLEFFKGRIEREHWVEQARAFAAEPTAAKRPQIRT